MGFASLQFLGRQLNLGVRSVTFLPEGTMVYQETFVRRDQHRIYVRDHPGAEPTIVVMHGFPDNLHLYDRLLPS